MGCRRQGRTRFARAGAWAALALGLAVLGGGPRAAAQQVDLVSRAGMPADSSGLASLAQSSDAATTRADLLSHDGRYAVFLSQAQNVLSGQIDTNGGHDCFLFDRQSNAIRLVSHVAGSPSTTGDQPCTWAAISADGSTVAFISAASNLLPGAGTAYLYLFDVPTSSATAVPGAASAWDVDLGGDGRSLVFSASQGVHFFDRDSGTTSLVVPNAYYPRLSHNGDWLAAISSTTGWAYLWDRTTGNLTLVSRAAGSVTTGAVASSVLVSGDGAHVAFSSPATNLVVGQVDLPNTPDLFLYERATGKVTLVTHTPESPKTSAETSSGPASAAFSEDGRYLAFTSWAGTLVAGQTDPSFSQDVFLYDRIANGITLVSHSADSATTAGEGPGTSASSLYPTISRDGAHVAFVSDAINLVPGQNESYLSPYDPAYFRYDVFVFERATGSLTLASHAVGEPTAATNDYLPGYVVPAVISGNGGHVLFAHRGDRLVGGMTSASRPPDIFLNERTSGINRLVTLAGQPSVTGNRESTPATVPATSTAGLSVSADGRYIVFRSRATNLVPGQVDTNGFSDLFLYDRSSGHTALVTRADGFAATTANSVADAGFAAISADGRYVVFASDATNLVPALIDNNGPGGADYYLYERATGVVRLVSHLVGADTATSQWGTYPSSAFAALSDDGAWVAFWHNADLGSGWTGLHLYERATGTVTPLDPPPVAAVPFAEPSLSTNGDVIAFVRYEQVGYRLSLLDRSTGVLRSIADGNRPSLSADGRFLAFSSTAADVVPGVDDTNQASDVFLYDRTTAETVLVSHAFAGLTAVGGRDPRLSRDGRYVVFTSASTSLVGGQDDSNNALDVFLYDRASGTNSLVSRVGGSATLAAGGDTPVISDDGAVVAFTSTATNLFPGQSDSNQAMDVFLFEPATGNITLASRKRDTPSTAGDLQSWEPVLSASGSHVVFRSDAPDLVANDWNAASDAFVFGVCGSSPVITQQPTSPAGGAAIGSSVTFQVFAINAGRYQWQRDGVDIPGARSAYYTTPPVTAADSGATFRAVAFGACQSQSLSQAATLTIADDQAPTVHLVSPTGGEYWLLSPSSGPPNRQVVSWSMADNVRICRVEAALLFSTNGGQTYAPAPAGGGLPGGAGAGGACPYPGTTLSNVEYTVPTAFPSGQPGSLYKVRVTVTDQIGLQTVAESRNPFYLVSANPDSVRTLILANLSRMQARAGVTAPEAAALHLKLQELGANPKVQGVVVDLGEVTDVTELLAAWDADPGNAAKANAVLFGCHVPYPAGCLTDRERKGVHQTLSNRLDAFTGVKYVVLVGDDRIIPFARLADRTALLPESAYTDSGLDLTSAGTTVGQALAQNFYLSDDPLAVLDPVTPDGLHGALFVPDLSIGRLVETPSEMTTAIATFIGQDGVLDLSALHPSTGHKVFVSGYDFLVDSAAGIRKRWKGVLGAVTPDGSLAPVDGTLIGGGWNDADLRTHLAGNGGSRYAVLNLNGHATHYAEGAPGADFRFGLEAQDMYGADACASPSQGALDFSGSVIYAVGCHGGLPVPGTCATDADHSLDLPQTFLARGAVAYVANTGYGWGLKHGVGYGERLVDLLTREMTKGGTVVVGDAVTRTKQKYVLHTPRPDAYDDKSLMQWTVFGLPMYAVKTGIDPGAATAPAAAGLEGVGVTGRASGPDAGLLLSRSEPGVAFLAGDAAAQLPGYLTQLNLHFDLTAPGIYEKKNSLGEAVAGTGCSDTNGCYYTLNGLATGSADLPIEPYFIYDSRLSGTSQHGVLWKGGLYEEEAGFKPVVAELVSNGGDGSNHGNTPRVLRIRPTGTRLVPGQDPEQCRPSDTELNSLVMTVGEAVKALPGDATFSIARRYREADLEVFYFNDSVDSTNNCDRTGPALGSGPFGGSYHQATSGVVEWAVPATDSSGVWRVVVVYTDNAVTAGRGRWTPFDLVLDGQLWRGSAGLPGSQTATYVIQAVDNRGNVTWLDFVGATLPSSGVPLGVPEPVDVLVPATAGLSITGFSPQDGTVGTGVQVVGTGFSGTTRVTFNGVAAPFLVDSDVAISTLVPPGASSGPIHVTTPSGTTTSSQTFSVTGSPGPGPYPAVSVNDVSVVEDLVGAASAIFTVSLDETATQPVLVSYSTSDGTAKEGKDYLATQDSLTLPSGSDRGYVSVPLLPNSGLDGTRHFFLDLTGIVNGTLARSRGQAWILDQGPGQRLAFTLTHYSAREGAPSAAITVRRTGGTAGTATVKFATSDGSAAAPGDYEPAIGTLTLPPGTSSRSFSIKLGNDTLFRGPRTVLLALSEPTGAVLGDTPTAVLTIADNDPAGSIQLAAKSFSAGVGSGTVQIPVTRSGGTAGGVRVRYATVDGTARAGIDYVAAAGPLSFGPKATKAAIPLTLLNDGLLKGDLKLELVLSDPEGGAVLGPVTRAPFVIVSDDPVVQFGAAAYSVAENGKTATILVKRGGLATGTLEVGYGAVGGTATSGVDYEPFGGTLTFPPGVKVQSFQITVLPDAATDTVLESDETVELALSNPTGGALGLQSTAVLTLKTDEPLVSFAAALSSVAESAGKATIGVRRTPPATAAAAVDYATSDGTAVAGEDYLTTADTLTFAPGVLSRTFTVPIVAGPDGATEETVNLTLGNPQGVVLGSPAAAQLKIVDASKAGAVQFTATDFSASEIGPFATLTVTRVGGTAGVVTVHYATADGTAVAGEHYVARQGVLTLPDGEPSKTLLITVLDDDADSGNRFFDVTLSAPTGGAVLGAPLSARVWMLDRH